MSDDNSTNKKRNRKSKLVPREICNEDEPEDDFVQLEIKVENEQSELPESYTFFCLDDHEPTTQNTDHVELQDNRYLNLESTRHVDGDENTKSEILPPAWEANKVILPETVSSMQFSVNVEVEECDDEYRLTIDEDKINKDSTDSRTSIEDTIINVTKQLENNRKTESKPSKCIKPVKKKIYKRKIKDSPLILSISNAEIQANPRSLLRPANTYFLPATKLLTVANDILKKSDQVSDQILALEVRNALGRTLVKKLQIDPIEGKIQSVLDSWNNRKRKTSPLIFKCYACELAWWHLYEFKEHLKQHADLNVMLEDVSAEECNMVAYRDNEMKKIDIVVGDLCWRCGKAFHVHRMKSRLCDGFYSCTGCYRHFITCTGLSEHESECAHKPIAVEPMQCTICPRVFPTLITLNAHYLLTHDVRSDVPSLVPYKKCNECAGKYFIFNMHVCPARTKNVPCNFCFRRFTHRSLADLHMAIDNRRFHCTICSLALPKRCMELEHVVMHDDSTTNNFMFVYKCMMCDNNTGTLTILTDDLAISIHRNYHNVRFDKKRSYFEKLLIPVVALKESVSDPNREVTPEPETAEPIAPVQNATHEPVQKIKIEFDDPADDVEIITVKNEPIDLDDSDSQECESNIHNTSMQESNIQNTIMQESNIQNTIMQESNIQNTIMQESNIHNTSMRKSNIQKTSMQESNIHNRNMQELNIKQEPLDIVQMEMNIKQEYIEPEEVHLGLDINTEQMESEQFVTEELIIKEESDSDEEEGMLTIDESTVTPEISVAVEKPTFTLPVVRIISQGRKRGRPRLTDEERALRKAGIKVPKINKPPKVKRPKFKHIKSLTMDTKGLYACWLCGFQGHYQDFRDHMLGECGTLDFKPIEQNYVCTKCDTSHKSLKDYLFHFQLHGFSKCTCPVCSKQVTNYTTLQLHVNRHLKQSFQKIYSFNQALGGLKWKCLDCGQVMETAFFEHWESHMRLTDPDKELMQEIKVERSPTPTSEPEEQTNNICQDMIEELIERLQAPNEPIRSNEPSSLGRRLRQCIQCFRIFSRYYECKRHIIEHLLADAFSKKGIVGALRCQICNEGFSHPDKYKKHMRDHGSLPIFYCELCDKTFSDSSNFAKHKKIHNIKVLVCDICKGRFQAKKSLEKHMLMHEKTGAISCNRCDRKFMTNALYRKHIRTSHVKKAARFACRQCQLTFTSLKDKWDHMWEVHKERTQEADCPVCPERFRNFHRLTAHMRIHNLPSARKMSMKQLYKSLGLKKSLAGETVVIYE